MLHLQTHITLTLTDEVNGWILTSITYPPLILEGWILTSKWYKRTRVSLFNKSSADLYDWFILREILHVDLFKEKNKF
jgi:hypothetical protein